MKVEGSGGVGTSILSACVALEESQPSREDEEARNQSGARG